MFIWPWFVSEGYRITPDRTLWLSYRFSLFRSHRKLDLNWYLRSVAFVWKYVSLCHFRSGGGISSHLLLPAVRHRVWGGCHHAYGCRQGRIGSAFLEDWQPSSQGEITQDSVSSLTNLFRLPLLRVSIQFISCPTMMNWQIWGKPWPSFMFPVPVNLGGAFRTKVTSSQWWRQIAMTDTIESWSQDSRRRTWSRLSTSTSEPRRK